MGHESELHHFIYIHASLPKAIPALAKSSHVPSRPPNASKPSHAFPRLGRRLKMRLLQRPRLLPKTFPVHATHAALPTLALYTLRVIESNAYLMR